MARYIWDFGESETVLRNNAQTASGGAQWLVLALCVIVCLGTAALGAAFTNVSVSTWYMAIQKPSWTPPNWLFAPVWTLLYMCMAVSAWLVWRKHGWADAALPLLLFGTQLVLNAIWSALFFGLRSPSLGLADIVLLWVAIVATVAAFGRVSLSAAALLLPYLGWVSFATALNFAIWRLNP